jgi:hypothetical protein
MNSGNAVKAIQSMGFSGKIQKVVTLSGRYGAGLGDGCVVYVRSFRPFE